MSGDQHRRNRRLVQPAFHHGRIAGYARTIREQTLAATASWRDDVRIAADQHFSQLTLRVVGKTLFSTELGAAVVDEVVRSMPTVLGGITRRAVSPSWLERLPTPANRRFDLATRRLREVVDRIITQYRDSGIDHGDMASMLLLARDSDGGGGLGDEQVRNEVLTMLMAGTETTANTLSWAVHALGRHPEAEAKLHAEVDAVEGADGVGVEQFTRLPYARQVISETLRLYPPAWILTRRTTEAVTLGGVDLPAKAEVVVSPYAMHRDPLLFDDPEVFDPDRWSPARAGDIPRPAFVPFGAGNRQCIGESFAWAEAVIVLATIASRWTLRPVQGVTVRPMAASATMAPKEMPMIVRQRTR